MLTDTQKQRMELAKSTEYGKSNCAGTLLYVLGVLKKDRYVNRKFTKSYLEKMTPISESEVEEGAVLVLRNFVSFDHVGIVVGTNPIKIYHRPGRNSLECSEPLEDVLRGFSSLNVPEFYIYR